MREIIFRGQTRRNGEQVWMSGEKVPGRWVYGGVLQGCGAHSIIYGGENVDNPGEGLNKWVVYTDTLGQYTGVKDKNGKKIFEGDIVLDAGEPCKIVFEDGQWKEIYAGDYWADLYGSEVEIVGNIYDNPELLKGGGADA